MNFPSNQSQQNPKIHFYSWAHNLQDKKIIELQESASYHGISIKFLGAHLKAFGTTFTKARLLYKELGKIDENDIVCAVDAFDVFVCDNAQTIKEKFLSFKCDCVVSAERGYSQQYEKDKSYYEKVKNDSPYSETPYIYLNAGSIIGYAGALKKIYAPTFVSLTLPRLFFWPVLRRIRDFSRWIKKIFRLENYDPSSIVTFLAYTDQKHISISIAKNPYKLKIILDYNTELFWCSAWEWENIEEHFYIQNKRIINKHTKNAPPFIHVPGIKLYRHIFTQLFEVEQSLRD